MLCRLGPGPRFQVLAFIVVLAACEEGPVSRGTGAFSVRDSSGVLIASNSGPDRVLEPIEVLRFGVTDGDPNTQFDGITGLEVDPVGGIWVCDSNESVRYYDASGALRAELGGRGEGPGETPSYWGGVCLGERSILTYAVGHDLQTFGFDGSFLGSRSVLLRPLQVLLPLGPSTSKWMFYLRVLPDIGKMPTPETWVIGRGPSVRNDFDSLFTVQGRPLSVNEGGFWSNGSFFDGTPSIGATGHLRREPVAGDPPWANAHSACCQSY